MFHEVAELGVYALAEEADLPVIESTFPAEAAALASDRDPSRFHDEAAEVFDGTIVVAEDLTRVGVPKRRGQLE